MTSRDFAFWLQGYFEISGVGVLSAPQVETVKAHLALVFKHEIDPSMGDAEHQAELNAVHSPANKPKIGGQGPNGSLLRC